MATVSAQQHALIAKVLGQARRLSGKVTGRMLSPGWAAFALSAPTKNSSINV